MNNKFKKIIISLTILSLSLSAFCIPSFGVEEEEITEASPVVEPIIIDPIEEEPEAETEKQKTEKQETEKQETEKQETPKKETSGSAEKKPAQKKQESKKTPSKKQENKNTQSDNRTSDNNNNNSNNGSNRAGNSADNNNTGRVPDNEVAVNANAVNQNTKTGFTVYIELNNGQERLRYDMKEPGLVTKPNNNPERKGFIFKGYYADEKFTEKWDFNKNIANDGTVIYVKWKADKSGKLYDVEIADLIGGKITANPEKAVAGEQINITVVPDEGNRMREGTLTVNGVQTDFLSFKMGEEPVVISAEFERIPTQPTTDHNSRKIVALAVVGIVSAIVIAILIFVFRRRRSVYDEQIPTWVDDSIVVEEGFKDGKVVKENTENEFVELDEESFITIDDDDLR